MNCSEIPIRDIDEKLDTIKLIITDSTESFLLDLLRDSDLDIETAIGRYFSGNTPSPPPSHSNNDHNHNHRGSPNRIEYNWFNHNHSNSSSSDSTNNDLDDIEGILRDTSIDALSISPPSNRRRRRRSESISQSAPPHKKRKLNQQPLTDTLNSTTNHNVNSNNSNDPNCDFMDIDSPPPRCPSPKPTSSPRAIVNRRKSTWKKKKMGTITVKFVDLHQQRKSKENKPKKIKKQQSGGWGWKWGSGSYGMYSTTEWNTGLGPMSWYSDPKRISSLEVLRNEVQHRNIRIMSSSPSLGTEDKTLYNEVMEYQKQKDAEQREEAQRRMKAAKVW